MESKYETKHLFKCIIEITVLEVWCNYRYGVTTVLEVWCNYSISGMVFKIHLTCIHHYWKTNSYFMTHISIHHYRIVLVQYYIHMDILLY